MLYKSRTTRKLHCLWGALDLSPLNKIWPVLRVLCDDINLPWSQCRMCSRHMEFQFRLVKVYFGSVTNRVIQENHWFVLTSILSWENMNAKCTYHRAVVFFTPLGKYFALFPCILNTHINSLCLHLYCHHYPYLHVIITCFFIHHNDSFDQKNIVNRKTDWQQVNQTVSSQKERSNVNLYTLFID